MEKKTSVNFEQKTAERLIQNSKYIDMQPRSRVRADAPPISYGGSVVIRLTTDLTRATNATPGRGYGIIQQFDGVIYTDIGTQSFLVLNIHSALILNNSNILCSPAYGIFHFVTTSCGNIVL